MFGFESVLVCVHACMHVCVCECRPVSTNVCSCIWRYGILSMWCIYTRVCGLLLCGSTDNGSYGRHQPKTLSSPNLSSADCYLL